ncbi:MAG: glycoside hydrolase family 30 protein [Bacilli bacterium]|jgi:glucosylceramidase
MIKTVQTAKRWKKRWKEIKISQLSTKFRNNDVFVEIFPNQKYQQIIGFGGAFTEAACATIMGALPSKVVEMMHAYFSESGLNYNLGRVPIHSCDFSLNPYTYVREGDMDLSSFDISRETKYFIPVIQMASAVRGEFIQLLASPWSPPAYMKTNNSMVGGGSLKEEYKDLWAKYIVKYLLAMREYNVHFSYLSIQNEPEATQKWESCLYTANEEGDFSANHLYPALVSSHLEKIRILAWDHNRDRIVKRAQETFADKRARDIIWGLAYHWYVSDEHHNLSTVHSLYPEKHLLFTEGCVELTNGNIQSGNIGSWRHGELYGRNMINDFNNFTEGWIDWNLVVNEIGGPNHAKNYCEAPVMYHRQTNNVIYNPSYYYIGHFSKFIKPQAHRLSSIIHGSKKVFAVAFKNPNEEFVIVIQNEGHSINATIKKSGCGTELFLPSHSITTVIINNQRRG